MDEVDQISDQGTRLLQDLMRFRPEGLTANAWAVKAGVSRTIWVDLKRHGNPSLRTLEKLLGAADSSLGEFEALRLGATPQLHDTVIDGVGDAGSSGWRPAPLVPVPLLATAMAGEWGEAGSGIELGLIKLLEVIGWVDRPASLTTDRDAFAITVVGDSMWPRFRPGRRLLVSPAAPIAIGDDVVLRLANSGGGGVANVLVKELADRTASFVELRQFNPDVRFRVAAKEVSAIHKVVGEAI